MQQPPQDTAPDSPDPTLQREESMSRWDSGNGNDEDAVPKLTDAELVQLRIRVIALENLVIALLAELSDGQLVRACDMASYISPRPGFTPHPLTIHAARQMVHLIERSGHFRPITPG